jgi:uncharacterized protein
VETIDWADGDAIAIFAADAVFGNNVCHGALTRRLKDFSRPRILLHRIETARAECWQVVRRAIVVGWWQDAAIEAALRFSANSSPMQFSIDYLTSLREVDAAALDALLPPGDPFANRSFLVALESHRAVDPSLGWSPAHVAARDEQGHLVGLLPLYFKGNSFGEFIYDWSWAAAFRQAGIAYYPKLFSGIPYTPATGARLWTQAGPLQQDIRRALIEAAMGLAREQGLSSWHVAFPAADESALLEAAGLLVRKDVQFHWFNRGYRHFPDFMHTLASDKRRKLKAEQRKVAEAGIVIEQCHGDAIDPALWQQLHALYVSTFDKFGNHPAISADCFAEIGKALGSAMVVFIARLSGVPVAVSICFRSADVLYGRYWGASGRFDGLHFELCYYQGIDYCIREGLARFEPGAGGEHKIARGFEPTAVTTLHWIADPQMREVLRSHLVRVDASIETYREEAAEHLPFRNGEGSAIRSPDVG